MTFVATISRAWGRMLDHMHLPAGPAQSPRRAPFRRLGKRPAGVSSRRFGPAGRSFCPLQVGDLVIPHPVGAGGAGYRACYTELSAQDARDLHDVAYLYLHMVRHPDGVAMLLDIRRAYRRREMR